LQILSIAVKSLVRKRKSFKENQSDGLSFLDHLQELRSRLIKCLVAVAVAAIPCFIYWRTIFDLILAHPLKSINPKPHITVTAPAEPVMISMEIAIVSGIILASPVIFYQAWRFVSPALYKHEKRAVFPIVFSSAVSFFIGIAFSCMIIPLLLRVFSTFGGGVLESYYKAKEYIGFVVKISLACGLIFELPVLSFILTKMGFLTPRFLLGKIRHAVVASFIVAAILTPPDMFSQFVMAMPLLALYGVSVLVAFMAEKKKV
jgi:sec-independent protein translocase protein TatC